MKMFVISDNSDTYTGLRLTGIDGVVVHTKKEVQSAIQFILEDKEIGILLINGALAKLCPDEIGRIKKSLSRPLLVEIPDRHGKGRDENAIAEYIRSAVGINI